MRRILDRAVLLLYCFSPVWVIQTGTSFLAAFLISVIYSCGSCCILQQKYRLILSCLCIALILVCPDLALFFPVFLYGMMEDSRRIPSCLFAVLSLWRVVTSYPWEILFLLAVGSLFSLLLNAHSSSCEALDQRLRQSQDDGREKNLLLKEKNQALLEKQDYEVYAATLRERNRIAREIHDNVGHMLSRSILLVGAAKAVNRQDCLLLPLNQLETTLNTAMTNIRESVHDLHDESLNLKAALTELTENFSFCPIRLDYEMGYEVPRSVKYSLICIVKEGLNNIMRHSNATRVHLTLREHPGLWQLILEDNGTAVCPEDESGLGLSGMKERVDSLGGLIQIQKEQGFRIFIIIPKKGDDPYDYRADY